MGHQLQTNDVAVVSAFMSYLLLSQDVSWPRMLWPALISPQWLTKQFLYGDHTQFGNNHSIVIVQLRLAIFVVG